MQNARMSHSRRLPKPGGPGMNQILWKGWMNGAKSIHSRRLPEQGAPGMNQNSMQGQMKNVAKNYQSWCITKTLVNCMDFYVVFILDKNMSVWVDNIFIEISNVFLTFLHRH